MHEIISEFLDLWANLFPGNTVIKNFVPLKIVLEFYLSGREFQRPLSLTACSMKIPPVVGEGKLIISSDRIFLLLKTYIFRKLLSLCFISLYLLSYSFNELVLLLISKTIQNKSTANPSDICRLLYLLSPKYSQTF